MAARTQIATQGFIDQERAQIDAGVTQAFQTENLTGAVVFGIPNITYASGIVFPFAEQYSERRAALVLTIHPTAQKTLVVPAEWQAAVLQQGWKGRVVAYRPADGLPPAGLLQKVCQVILETAVPGDFGIDREQTPASLFQQLQKRLPGFTWKPADDLWQRQRIIKTGAEIRLIEEAARHADRGMVSALNHSEGCVLDGLSYSVWEFTERIRVHVGEFGGSATGQVVTLQGDDMRRIHTTPHGNLIPGTPIRTDLTNHHYGYWAASGRTFCVGLPPAGFAEAYRANVALKRQAVALLKPGAVCQDIFQAIAQAADQAGVRLWAEAGIGHGVGASEREAPFLCPGDATVLQPGMVIALAVTTLDAQDRLICSKDTYAITPDGCRLLSWYRDWDSNLYRLVGNTARHG